ncbi:MAG: caspase family protein [Armatimonadetes bacterium]|nr:caspase family protein [Armatimonadota bacterium]
MTKTCLLAVAAAITAGVSLFGGSAENAPVANRYALLVGISDYSKGTNPKDGWRSLNTGPDLVHLRRVLEESYGFQNLLVLENSQATQEEIKKAFRSQLIENAKKAAPGSSFVFYYTGHGHQVWNQKDGEPGRDAEPDDKDECLVTWVSAAGQSKPDAERLNEMYLRDDDLNALLRELSAATGGKSSITVILDSCHSGTGAKGFAEQKGRAWSDAFDPPRPPELGADPSAHGPLATPQGSQDGEQSGWSTEEGLPKGVVFVSGCESGQFSYMMDDKAEGSVMTYFLCQALTEAAIPTAAASNAPALDEVTYRSIHEWVQPRVTGKMPAQWPQVEGPIDTPIFGDGKPIASRPYLLATKATGTNPITLTFASGKLRGVTEGSTYTLFKPGSNVDAPANRIAEVKIIPGSVGMFESQATVVRFTGPPLEAAKMVSARAMPKEIALPLRPLAVSLAKSDPRFEAIANLPFVRAETTEGKGDVALASVGGKKVWQRSTGMTLLEDSADLEAITARLLAEWRWQELTRLASGPNAPRVKVRLVRVKPGMPRVETGEVVGPDLILPSSAEPGGVETLLEGDEAYVVCENRSFKPLHVALLYLLVDGSIRVYPDPARGVFDIQIEGDGKPRRIAFLRNAGHYLTPNKVDREVFKLIASEKYIDLTGVAYEASERPNTKGDKHGLQDLLLGIRDGRSKGPDVEFDAGASFAVSDLTLVTRRK